LLILINQAKHGLSINAALANPLSPADSELRSLHYAAWTGNLSKVRSLVNMGLEVSSQDSDGFTALHLAVFNMHTDVVKVLMEKEPSIVDVSTETGVTALHIAIFDDNVEVTNLLLKADPKPLDGLMTPIHLAVIADSINAIKTLIEPNTDITAQSCEGLTPVHFAALYGKPVIITWLDRAGANISCRDQKGRAPIHLAAFSGKTENIKVLLKAGADIQEVDNDGKTPLHYLAGNPRFDLSRLVPKTVGQMLTDTGRGLVFSVGANSEAATTLINAGADVSCSDNDGCTPIFDAAMSGRIEAIHALINARANVSFRDMNGATPICYAAQAGHIEAITLLEGAGGSVRSRDDRAQTAMFYAASYGHVKGIETLQNAGAKVSLQDENGWTPMHLAAGNGHVGVINALKDAGADVSAQNEDGWTPMHLAAKTGHIDAIKALKKAGADVSAQMNNGWTPMYLAAKNGRIDSMKTLKKVGADFWAERTGGWSLMHMAAQNGHVQAIKALKEAGEDVLVQENDGWTPIHCAANNGHVDAIKVLIEAGAEVSIPNSDGRTPMHLAAQNGHIDTIKALKEVGADVSVQENDGWTPIHCAANNGHVDAIKVLIEAGAEVSVRNSDGRTPMYLAVQNRHVDAIKALKDAGANIEKDGGTLMHLAAQNRKHRLQKTRVTHATAASPSCATAVSPSCELIALVSPKDFQIFSIVNSGSKLNTKLRSCGFNDGRFGKSTDALAKSMNDLASPRKVPPEYTFAVMSDSRLCIACKQECVDVHDITSRRLRSFKMFQKCRTMRISPNGKWLAIATENGRLLLNEIDGSLEYTVKLGSDNSARISVNCMSFSPDSAFISAATSENIVCTYSLDGDQGMTLLSESNRALGINVGRENHLGVTSLALYSKFYHSQLTHSSLDSKALLILADAPNGFPVIIKNITSPSNEHQEVSLNAKEYKYRNCCAAYSPLSHFALIITRAGTIKMINCDTGPKAWTVVNVGETVNVSGTYWQVCSLVFSRDGDRAVAFDCKGKVVVMDFGP